MTWLLIVLGIAALVQPSGSRKVACILFVLDPIAFDILCGGLCGEIYFLAGAATSGICCALLVQCGSPWYIVKLCVWSIILNISGWVAFELGMRSAPYELCFTVYYIVAILLIAFGGLADGVNQISGNGSRFLLYPDNGNKGY